MSVVLHHHPFSRAATVVWMLEEVGVPYTLHHVDLMTGAQKRAEHVALNPMGKLPVLEDGAAVVSEGPAIGLYLADRYAYGRLAPAMDDPRRGAYLRACVFATAVVEPAALAKRQGWEYAAGNAGFGSYDDMMDSVEATIRPGPWVLGDMFSMADVVLGATVRYLLRFKMMDPRPEIVAYVARLDARPASIAADARNAAAVAEHGLGR